MWYKEIVTQQTRTKCCQKVYHTEDIDQMWSKTILPLMGGLCHADSDQMWSNDCPSCEDFVTRTPTKCGPKIAPHGRTLSRGLQPNVVQRLPLIGGLCHADSDQMWSNDCPSWEDFVTRTSTKCGPMIAPHGRTLSHGLRPNVVQ
jgi:hypothetical protein